MPLKHEYPKIHKKAPKARFVVSEILCFRDFVAKFKFEKSSNFKLLKL